MEKRLKINEVARLLCTTPDAIRLYERKRIIQPVRDQSNRYRGFSQEDITRLYDCKLLQNVGFSLSEIADVVSEVGAKDFDRMLEEKAAELEQKVQRYNRVLEQMHRLQNAAHLLECYRGQYLIQDSPHVLVCSYAKGEELNRRSLECSFYRHVIEYHNMFRRCFVIAREDALSDVPGMNGMPGYSIEIGKAAELGLNADDVVSEWRPKRCVYTVIEAEERLKRSDLQPAYDWIAAHNFRLTDDILAWALKIVFDHGKVSRLYAVWLPIE